MSEDPKVNKRQHCDAGRWGCEIVKRYTSNDCDLRWRSRVLCAGQSCGLESGYEGSHGAYGVEHESANMDWFDSCEVGGVPSLARKGAAHGDQVLVDSGGDEG